MPDENSEVNEETNSVTLHVGDDDESSTVVPAQ